jgi:hypothetical protein
LLLVSTCIARHCGGPLEHRAIALDELLAGKIDANRVGDFFTGRPEIAQIDGLAVLAGAERRGGNVLVHRPQQGIGDDQRGAGEIIRAHIGMHAALEVAVAGQHRNGDEAVVFDCLGDRLIERTGITDAGRAPITDEHLRSGRGDMLWQLAPDGPSGLPTRT